MKNICLGEVCIYIFQDLQHWGLVGWGGSIMAIKTGSKTYFYAFQDNFYIPNKLFSHHHYLVNRKNTFQLSIVHTSVYSSLSLGWSDRTPTARTAYCSCGFNIYEITLWILHIREWRRLKRWEWHIKRWGDYRKICLDLLSRQMEKGSAERFDV